MTASMQPSHFVKAAAALAVLLAATLLPLQPAHAADSGNGQCRALSQHMLDALIRGDSQTAAHAFDSDMRSALPPEKLSELWSEVKSNFGAYKTRSNVRTMQVNGMEVVITPMQFAKTALDAQVACNARGQIAGFFLRPEHMRPENI